jgi:hypothetical protein
MSNFNIYNKLPAHVRLFDSRGLIQHLANVYQSPVNRFQRAIDSSTELFNPGVLALTRQEFLDFLGQFVGLGTRDGEYLGIGLNPEWPAAHKALVIEEIFQYWLQKGTEPGVRKALRLWLRWLDADNVDRCRIVLPIGKVSSDRATLWFDHFTSFDDPYYQVKENKQQLLSGDYRRYYTPNEKRLHQDVWTWEYDQPMTAIGEHELVQTKPPRRLGEGSHLIDHAPWEHFWLERHFEWNKVNPDILKLNPHILSAVARPVPFSWLKPSFAPSEEILEITIPYSGEKVSEVCVYELDGIGYGDAVQYEPTGEYLTSAWKFPYLGEYIETIVETEIVETGVWWPFDHYDLFGGVGVISTEVTGTNVEAIDSTYWSALAYESVFGSANTSGEVFEGAFYWKFMVTTEDIVLETPIDPINIAFRSQFYAPATGIEVVTGETQITNTCHPGLYIGIPEYESIDPAAIYDENQYVVWNNEPIEPEDSPETPDPEMEAVFNINWMADHYSLFGNQLDVEASQFYTNEPEQIVEPVTSHPVLIQSHPRSDYLLEETVKIATHLTVFGEGYPWYRIGEDTFEEISYRLSPIDVFTIDLGNLTAINVFLIAIQPYIEDFSLFQLCNVFATWNYEILAKECYLPEIKFDSTSYEMLKEIQDALSWSLILELNEKMTILKPITLFWANADDAADLAISKYIPEERGYLRKLRYSEENSYLCIEFNAQPDDFDAIRSIALLFKSELVEYRSPVTSPLSFISPAGFRFVVHPNQGAIIYQ